MSTRIWGTDTTLWSQACWPWSECVGPSPAITEIHTGVDAETLIQPWLREEEPWDAYKKIKEKNRRRRLIKLICKVKGVNYNEEKEIKDFHLSVDEIKMIVKAMPQIDLKLENEDIRNIQNRKYF